MSTAKDTTTQSDIQKMKTEPDGSFKRLDSTFRNTIEKGGKFEPEKGEYHILASLLILGLPLYRRSVPSLCFLRLP